MKRVAKFGLSLGAAMLLEVIGCNRINSGIGSFGLPIIARCYNEKIWGRLAK